MRPVDNIEKLIKKLRYKASAETHDRILDNILQALEEKEKQKPAAVEPDIGRKIMRSPVTKLAAAAVIIIVVMVCIHQFGSPIGGASVAWADVVRRAKQSYDEYYTELLSAMENKDVKKASHNADALSEFWQGINILAEAKLDPTIQLQSEDSLNLIRFLRGKTAFDEIDKNTFQAYANEFLKWLNKIEDEAWINEIIHISKEMEEYAEEIRDSGRNPEIDFSYADHCLTGFVTYCEWFEQLPWNSPEQNITPSMVLSAIERDLKIARREIETMERSDADRLGKRCMQHALRNAQYLDKKIKSSRMFDQWKLCNRLTQKISELSGLMAYLAIASGDITQTNKVHNPEAVHQILTGKFANRESFADYFVEQVDRSLDLCEQLWAILESTR